MTTLELNRSTAPRPAADEQTGSDPLPRPLTHVELAIAEASRQADAHDPASAEAAYLHADQLLGSERSPRHAEVLVCLAVLQRRRGALAEAATNLDLALAIFPEHRAALSQRLSLAHEQGDLATSAAIRARMLTFCESDEAQVHVLTEVADDAIHAAAQTLRQAIALRPKDLDLRERLRALLEAISDYDGAVDASVAIAESLPDPKARARVLARAAGLCAQKVGNVDRSVALYEAAIADDPTVAGAFAAIETVLVEAGDVEGTERAYIRQIERLRAGGHEREEAVLLHKLALLREEQLADSTGAVSALERATTLRPDDVPSRLLLARVLERQGASDTALRYLECTAAIAPMDPTAYHEMSRIARSAGAIEPAFFASSALVHLGEADESEQALYRQFANYGAPSANQSFGEMHLARLRPAEHPVRTLLLCIHDAAIAAKLQLQQNSKASAQLDERERQDPERSTVSAVRVVAWTIKFLGLPNFALYVRPAQRFALAHPTSAAPALVLGAGMLSGRSVPELLFRTAYELGAQRELGRLPVFYPTPEELETLVAAAVGLFHPAKLPSNAVALAKTLDSTIDRTSKTRLAAMIDTAASQHIELDLPQMLRDQELVAARIGMLACADLTVAARQVAIETRAVTGLAPADRVRDLLAFAVSDVHAELRANLGMSLGTTKSITP